MDEGTRALRILPIMRDQIFEFNNVGRACELHCCRSHGGVLSKLTLLLAKKGHNVPLPGLSTQFLTFRRRRGRSGCLSSLLLCSRFILRE